MNASPALSTATDQDSAAGELKQLELFPPPAPERVSHYPTDSSLLTPAGFLSESARIPRFAMLIDAENVPARLAPELFRQVSELGEMVHCLIFGDWRSEQGKNWKAIANSSQPISLVQRLGQAGIKNSTDISMVIGAMDLLHRDNLDGFCLVSGDGDFVPLVHRLQSAGLWVYGYARRSPSQALAKSCNRFTMLDNPSLSHIASISQRLKRVDRVIVEDAMMAHERAEGWAALSAVGSKLTKTSSDYASNRWGFASLTKLLRALGCYEFCKANGQTFARRKSYNNASLRRFDTEQSQLDAGTNHEFSTLETVACCT